jgi:serine/threonine protein phosphatase 1
VLKKLVERILGRAESAGAETIAPEPGARGMLKPFLPPGRRLYCIGDIHGRLDLLDRGEQSKQVLDLLIDQPLEGFEVVNLLGNHEQSMLDFLEFPQAAAAWLSFGGQATLMSYGVAPGRVQMGRRIESLSDELKAAMPQSHLEFLRNLTLMHTEGRYCFVHAGIRPGVELENQAFEDLMWIRDEFIRSNEDHGCIVVHGHSITEEVEWRPNRIGIDTGAYYSGLLTALVLESDQQRLLQTGRD